MQIEIGQETENATQWAYDVQVHDNGRTHRYRVTLSFSDYDLWSKGRVSPSRVVEAAFEFLLDQESPDQIMSKFDCSVIRRYFPGVDKALPKRV